MTQGTFFKSDQVQNNLNDIFNTYQEIASVTSQLPKFNKQEKLEHIDKCKVLVDKQRTFLLDYLLLLRKILKQQI